MYSVEGYCINCVIVLLFVS